MDTDEHLPIVDGIGILEDVKESSDSRVLHVKGETGVAVFQLLDSLCAVVFLQGRVRTRMGVRSGAASSTFWNLEKNLDMTEREGRDGVASLG